MGSDRATRACKWFTKHGETPRDWSCDFDKHLYLTTCLNAHNHNTCIRLLQTGCTARKRARFIISQGRQAQVQAGDAMATIIIID